MSSANVSFSSIVDKSSDRGYLLTHQTICISSIDFQAKKLTGFVELYFTALKAKVTKVRLNAKQCRISRLLAKGSQEQSIYQICTFNYNDPLLDITQSDIPQPQQPTQEGDIPAPPERSLKKFQAKHQEAVISNETELGHGELVVSLPNLVQQEMKLNETFYLLVEYSIEKPAGGLHFVIPNTREDKHEDQTADKNNAVVPMDQTDSSFLTISEPQKTLDRPNLNNGVIPESSSQETDVIPNSDIAVEPELQQPTPTTSGECKFPTPDPQQETNNIFTHLYTYRNHNCSRLWFPCIDRYGQPCTWELEFTVESHLTVISCGDLISTHSSSDRKFKTFRYKLTVPTSAPNIGFVAGQFETWIDPASLGSSCPIKNYFLTGLNQHAKDTCSFMNGCVEFYEEELINFKYPFSNYKQVFVNQAYENYQSYATLTICCTNLLHTKRIIDQVFVTRAILSEALASQYFGCFIEMSSWAAAWLTRGISSYMAAQYGRKVFGNNEYRFKVRDIMKQLIDYEQRFGGIVLDETSDVPNKSRNNFHFQTQSPHTISPLYDETHRLKSFLVIRMLEDRIGKMLLVQVFNKILSLAATASQQPASSNMWGNMLLSTVTFERAVFTVTGKDKEIASFLEQWIYQGGHAKFNGTFIFDRKRNVVELQIRQPDTTSIGIRPYFGPVTVTVQELDGTFPQKLNIEENKTTPFVITCHSKSRRNKKKKIPLCTGEEVDMDLSMMDNQDSPVLWIRIDPDMQILRHIVFEQPDYQWQYQLKFERDITAQLDSLQVLVNYPTVATRKTLTDIIEDERCFYRVRCSAALSLTKVANNMAITTTSGGWQAPTSMINIYKRLFGSHTCPHIIRLNTFSTTNLQMYFLQKTIPKALAGLRVPPHRICPPEVLKFLLDLFKYNDNSKNNFSDNYYKAALIEALAETVTPVVVSLFGNTMQSTTIEQLPSETKLVAEEIARYLNLEKLLPGYKFVVTVACLKAIQQLQRMGHLPSNSLLFRSYTASDLFIDVRCAAVVELVDIIRAEQSQADLDFLLDLIETDKVPAFKFFILAELFRNPPSIQSFSNYSQVRERIWAMMNSLFAYDSKLRCASADVFQRLFGKSDKSSLSSGFPGDLNYKPKKKKKKKDKDRDKDKEKKRMKKKEKLRLKTSATSSSF